MNVPRIDIITPVLNEEVSFPSFWATVQEVFLSRTDAEYHFILVDDGSTDHTWELIEQASATSPRLRGVRLSRNFGAHIAVTAGFDLVVGDAATILPVDLQDPPEAVLAFVEAWRDGAEVVWGKRRSRDDQFWRVLFSKIFLWLIRRLALPTGTLAVNGSFLLVDRKVVTCLQSLREHNRVIFGLVAWTGFRQVVVEYDRVKRSIGVSRWTFGRMLQTVYDTLLGFSPVLPRLVTALGLIFAVIGFAMAGFFMLNALFGHPLVQGWSAIMVTLTFYFGVSFLILGTMSEYLRRIHLESTRRPLYFVTEDTAHPADTQKWRR